MSEQRAKPASLYNRLSAAAGASVVSVLIVNPLDVVKTRMQAQAALVNGVPPPDKSFFERVHTSSYGTASGAVRITRTHASLNSLYRGHDRTSCVSHRSWTVASCPGTCVRSHPSGCMPSLKPLSMWSVFRNIVRQEGYNVLWRGVHTSILISIPMVGVYMPLYDYLRFALPVSSAYSPVVAGVMARSAAVFCVAPLELVRTRLMATPAHTSAKIAAQELQSFFIRTAGSFSTLPKLWAGFAATLARDVPFSAVYWGLVEPIRTRLQSDNPTGTGVIGANLVAGSVAGAVAAGITTPFDVLKTRMQIDTEGKRTLTETMKHVYQTAGYRGFFLGLGPRAARAAPACAIVIASYELLKSTLEGEQLK